MVNPRRASARPGHAAEEQGQPDVLMATAPDVKAKIKRTIDKRKRRKELAKKAQKVVPPQKESRKGRRKRLVAESIKTPVREDSETMKQRHSEEWKAMKAEVARFKKERNHLPKKGSKEVRATVSQRMRQLLDDMMVRHEAELKAAGLAIGAPVPVPMDMSDV